MSFGPHLIAAQATIFGVLDQTFNTWCAFFFHLLVVMLLAMRYGMCLLRLRRR